MAEATETLNADPELVQAPVEIESKPTDLPKEVKITAEEGLNLRNIELNFMKEQMTSERAQRNLQDLNKSYRDSVEALVKKYGIDIEKYQFNGVSLSFARK